LLSFRLVGWGRSEGNLYRDGSILDGKSRELLEGSLLFGGIVELDESVSLRSVVVLLDNVGLLDSNTVSSHEGGEGIVIEAEGQVGNKEKSLGFSSVLVGLLGSRFSRFSGFSRLLLLLFSLSLLLSGCFINSLRSGLLGISSGLNTLGAISDIFSLIAFSALVGGLSCSLGLGCSWGSIGLILLASLILSRGFGLSGFSRLSFLDLFSLLRFLDQFDIDLSTINILVVELSNSSISSFFRFHLDESVSKRSGSSSDDVDINDIANSSEVGSQFGFFGFE
jgi:hypothetical protein